MLSQPSRSRRCSAKVFWTSRSSLLMSVIMRRSLSLHRDFPAHQARQQQVAGGAEVLALQMQRLRLRKKRLGRVVERIQQRAAWHEHLRALEVTRKHCRVCCPVRVILEIADE